MQKRGTVAIALGGGGARGLAHLGVLKVFEEAQIPIDFICGTSIGALIGALYALNPCSKLLFQKFLAFLSSPMYKQARFSRLVQKNQTTSEHFLSNFTKLLKKRIILHLAQSRTSLVGTKRVSAMFDFFLKNKAFTDLQIPFVATSVDLVSGQEVFHTSGSLSQAIMASAAIPGFLPPVRNNGQILVDGVVLNPVPVRPARQVGADIVIAVDVGKAFVNQPTVDNIVDIILRTHLITAHRNNELLLQSSDLVLKPNVGQYHWAEFHNFEEIVNAGEQVARQVLPVVKEIIRKNKKRSEKKQEIQEEVSSMTLDKKIQSF